jgi:dTDP-4-dehydrorhamnose reductase
MKHLFIGGGGLVGSAAVQVAEAMALDWMAISRPNLDLSKLIDTRTLPDADVVYLIAAIRKLSRANLDPVYTWRVNADAPVILAKHYSRQGTFVVFVSSDDVESAGAGAYARQKTFAESFMNTINAAIIRPGEIRPEAATEFAILMLKIGIDRQSGLYWWRRPL